MSKKDKKSKEVTCDVHQIHGYLNKKQSKVVATIAWNDDEPKLNIRTCYEKSDGELAFGKGITLEPDEVDELTSILVSARNTGELQKVSKDGKKKAVNFSKVFEEAAGIVQKRDAGETTEDGFIVLKKKPGVKLK